MSLAAALLGWIAGIGLNVLGDDLPLRTAGSPERFSRTVRLPSCPYCSRRYDGLLWSGLLAFLVRGGRCPHCSGHVRLRRPVVELALAVGFAYLWSRNPALGAFVPSAIVLSIFSLIAVIDIEHRLILHIVSVPSAAVVLLIGGLATDHGWGRTLLGGLAGFGIVAGMYFFGLAFAWFAARLRGRPLEEVVFGWGDVMLGGVVGLLSGWPGVWVAVLIAVLSGGAAAAAFLLLQLHRRRYTMFAALPYGPFLALGGLAVFLWGKEIAAWYLGR